MNEYFRNDIILSLDLKSHPDVLKEENQNRNYDARLIHNQKKPEYVQLTIFYKPSDNLFETLISLKEKGVSILKLIKPKIGIDKFENPDILDFSKSSLIQINKSNQWEHDKKPVILTINYVEVVISGRYLGDGRFQLTKNALHHILEYVHYGSLGRYESNDRFIESNENRETNFGPVNFILSLEHYYDQKYSTQELTILRDAHLTLTDISEKLTDTELIKLGNYLCLLMSYFWEKPVNFFNAKIRNNACSDYRTREIHSFCVDELYISKGFYLEDRFKNFYDFIESINYENFDQNSEILIELIPRILKVRNIDDVSAFMIIYNIIEKFRNYFLASTLKGNEYKIKEEFDFNLGKKKTDVFIKNKIKEIKEIVKENDKDDFEKIVSDKVTFIRKTGLKDQFGSLLTYLKLDSKTYEIDFKKSNKN